MGLGVSSKKRSIAGVETASKKNSEIEKGILDDEKREADTIKLLLLGGSQSGKSTIAKQMKIIHLDGFDESEMIHFRHLILVNVVEGMRELLKGLGEIGIEMDPETKESQEIFTSAINKDNVSVDIISIVQVLWKSGPIQQCFTHKDKLQIGDNVEHFMTNLERLGSTEFVPTVSDILFCRVATTGILEMNFPYKRKFFRLIDVGGQKSERRKWVHCFEDVTAVMFVAALPGYDQVLDEDSSTNRMRDAITLFNETHSNEYFKKSSTILFLNKKDIFLSKIARVPLRVGFPEYNGANTYSDASEYIKEQFMGQKNSPESVKQGRQVYCHFTNATNTQNVEVVFIAAADVIIKKALGVVGLF